MNGEVLVLPHRAARAHFACDCNSTSTPSRQEPKKASGATRAGCRDRLTNQSGGSIAQEFSVEPGSS
jgi:hypothetical protein